MLGHSGVEVRRVEDQLWDGRLKILAEVLEGLGLRAEASGFDQAFRSLDPTPQSPNPQGLSPWDGGANFSKKSRLRNEHGTTLEGFRLRV